MSGPQLPWNLRLGRTISFRGGLGRGRTDTPLRVQEPKSCASANSATRPSLSGYQESLDPQPLLERLHPIARHGQLGLLFVLQTDQHAASEHGVQIVHAI